MFSRQCGGFSAQTSLILADCILRRELFFLPTSPHLAVHFVLHQAKETPLCERTNDFVALRKAQI